MHHCGKNLSSDTVQRLKKDLIHEWEMVDRLKEDLARTDKKLAQAGKEKWQNLTDISALKELEESAKPKTFVRKICKVDSDRLTSTTTDWPQTKLAKLEESNWDSDWEEYFQKKEEEEEKNKKFSHVERRKLRKFIGGGDRLSAGYDPSQRKSKIYQLNEKSGEKETVTCIGKNEKSGSKDKKKNCQARLNKSDDLQKVGQVMEKQQKRFLPSSDKVLKVDAIIPISMASQAEKAQINPQRKVALARSMSVPSGFNIARQRGSNSGNIKEKKIKSEKKPLKKTTTTKKVAKISQNVEDYIICPSSWKKGRELFLKEYQKINKKELVTTDRNDNNKDKQINDDEQNIDVDQKDYTHDNKQTHLEENQHAKQINSVQTEETRIGNRTKVTKRTLPKQELEYQKISKERHYNADSIRDYITKRRKERLSQTTAEKQKKEKEKEDRKNKLQQLQALQKKLAKVSVVKRPENEVDGIDFEDSRTRNVKMKKTFRRESRELIDASVNEVHKTVSEEDLTSIMSDFGLSTSTLFEQSSDNKNDVEENEKIEGDRKVNERNAKLTSIHTTAISLQRQIADETARIARLLEFANDIQSENRGLLTISGPQEISNLGNSTVVGKNDEIGRGEPKSLDVNEQMQFETRHEKIVQSRSQFSVFEGVELPGIGNLVKHARSIVNNEIKDKAARTIQSYYRGYKVRRSLYWRLLRRKKQMERENLFNGIHNEPECPENGNNLSRIEFCAKTNNVNTNDRIAISSLRYETPISSSRNEKPISSSRSEEEKDLHSIWKKFLQPAKPDPYNSINTLYKTIGELHYKKEQPSENIPASNNTGEDLSIFPKKSIVREDLVEKSKVVDFSNQSSEKQMQQEEKEISSDPQNAVRNSASNSVSHSASIPVSGISLESVSSQIETSQFESTSVESSQSVDEVDEKKMEKDKKVEKDKVEKEKKEMINVDPNEIEVESLSGGSLDSSHETSTNETNNQPIDNVSLPEPLKYSPSSLKMWMSSELVYLESVEDSLRNISNVERIQGVTTAQQETVSLAQALQSEQLRRMEEVEKMRIASQNEAVEHQKSLLQVQKRHEDAIAAAVESVALVRSQASSAINSTAQKLMQTQAEAAKVTADAASQLAQANMAAIEYNKERKSGNKEVVESATSAAIAAVTSILKKLHKSSRSGDKLSLISTEDSENKTEVDNEQSYSQYSQISKSSKSATNLTRTNSSRKGTPSVLEEGSVTESEPSSIRQKLKDISSDAQSVTSGMDYEATLSEGSVEEDISQDESLVYSNKFETNSKSNQSSENSSPIQSVKNDQAKKNSGSLSSLDQAFPDKDSLKNFTLEMVRQYTKKEELRSKHQMQLLKLREKSLVEKTKAEVAWLELQKQQYRNKGEEEKMPPLRKRQRWLMLKLQQEQSEIKRLREAQLMAKLERQMLLQQQQQIAHMRQSTKQILGKIREISPGMQLPSLKSLPNSSRSLEVSPKGSGFVDTLSSSHTDDEPVVDTQSDVGEWNLEKENAPSRDSKSDSEIPFEVTNESIKTNPVSTRILQGLKKLEMNKQKLTAREKNLLERKKDAGRIAAMKDKLNLENEKTDSVHTKLDEPKETDSKYSGELTIKSEIKVDNSTLSVEEDLQLNQEKTVEESKSVQEDIKAETTVDYGNSFETTIKSNEKQSPPNLPIKLPLSPRTQQKRRDSSGSEDSFTVSQSETASDLSDIEGRVHALKEELRRRKVEADRLRKEQKRRNKERLKAQEASLIKQIEAYDKFIWQTKSELDHEIEIDAKSSVKPQIRRPQVAESRHVNKIYPPVVVGVKDDGSVENSLITPRLTSRDQDTIASSLSELITSDKSNSTSVEKFENDSENDESTSDSVKTVTEKTEDKSTNGITFRSEKVDQQEHSREKSLSEKDDGKSEQKLEESTIDVTDIETKIQSDDETMAEEIEDEEVDELTIEVDNVENVDSNERVEETENIENVEIVENEVQVDSSSPRMEKEETDDVNEEQEDDGRDDDGDANLDYDGNEEEKVVENVCVTSASSSSTFLGDKQDKTKLDNEKVDEIVEELLSRELNEAFYEINEKLRAKNYEQSEEMFIEYQCDAITDNCFSELFVENLDFVCNLYSNSRRHVSNMSVGERVKFILNDIEVKSSERNERVERANLSDILTICSPIAYNDVLTSPEGTPTTNSESPAREDSPLSKSSSSVQQDDFQAEGEEWFEDEMPEGSNFYQIYPCKQYYYIREIPNKPPPPYTPPPQAPSGVSSPIPSNSSLSLLPSSSSLHIKEENLETFASHTKAELQMLVARAVSVAHESISTGGTLITPPDDYFYIAATDDDGSEGHRAFRRFIFDLSGELLNESLLSQRESHAHHPPWMKPKRITRIRNFSVTNDWSELIGCIQSQVDGLIFSETNNAIRPWCRTSVGRKKQDRVDEILVRELREEELNWTNYDQDELTVKIQVTDSILNVLLKETAQLLISFSA